MDKSGSPAMKSRIAIIGAGPSGLAQLRAFEAARRAGDDIPDIVCYEKQADYGGLWNYTWRTGLDEYGEPVHGSMYRFLWSNGPKECLEFADYTFEEHFGRPIPSYPPRSVLHDYIKGRIVKSDIAAYIRLRHAVRSVAYDHASETFTLHVTDLVEDRVHVERFEHVVVATGHFSVPNAPSFPGFELFPGRVLHAHDFRDANEFAGKNVLIVGSSYSAEDIGIQCFKYGAASITYSYRTRPMGFDWPQGFEERPLLTRLDGNVAYFKDGTSRAVDMVILCTGYLHAFPFMSDKLRLRTRNRLYPPGLYKGIVFTANPRLLYIGMQDQFYTFNMFDAQAWYARDVMMGRIALPDAAGMEADIADWILREEAIADASEAIDFQTEYVRDLLAATDYPRLDVDRIAALFKEWERHKVEGITTYRDRSYPSVLTGTMAPPHHTPWMEALDDSLPAFLEASPR